MEEKKVKKEYTLNEITFNETNKVMAMLACLPIVGLILLFIEKNDSFVRYYAAQYTIVGAASVIISFLLGAFWILALLVGWIFWLAVFALIVVGMLKAFKGDRFDIPFVSPYALKLMSSLE